jgi:hypothetical protein
MTMPENERTRKRENEKTRKTCWKHVGEKIKNETTLANV